MPTLHLLPGQGPGDTGEIVLNPTGLKKLEELIKEAKEDGWACNRFQQRDGVQYSLWLKIIDRPITAKQWREVPLAHNGARQLRRYLDGQLFDLELLSANLIKARKDKGHDQRHAAVEIGRSVGFVSAIENGTSLPRPQSLDRLCAYIGSTPACYFVTTNNASVPEI